MKTTNWQPIETAPKTGAFLVWLEEPMLGSNVQVMNRKPNFATVGSIFASDAPKATHWQPLPEPP